MSRAVEANADGLVGPTHSYAGLSPGNLASANNRGEVSNPRAAALEGLTKMRMLADLGLPQFVLPPHERPDIGFLRGQGFSGEDGAVLANAWRDAPAIASAACSASAMWAANAATVTPSTDSADGRVHFTPANLLTQLHRSLETSQTQRSLRALFPDPSRFVVHHALYRAPQFADEGAANHVRLCADHGDPGVELFVWGREAWEAWPGRFPARQTREASAAIARRHGSRRPVLARQAQGAIDAGAFHNDVVCVGARTCLFHHERAFDNTAAVYDDVRRAAEGLFEPVFVEVTEAQLPFADAVSSYLFNAMLVSPPGADRLTLIAPAEARETPAARAVADALPASNGPIGRVEYADVRQSMRNGGGPACLRLRVACDPATVDPRFLVDEVRLDLLAEVVAAHWPEAIDATALRDPILIDRIVAARSALLDALDLRELDGD